MHRLARPLFHWLIHREYPREDPGLPILMYHRVLQEADPLMPGVPTLATMAAQFRTLSECFTVLPLLEASERLREGTLPRRALVITFDDGYRDNHDVAAPLLERFSLPATIFVATGFLDGGMMFNDVVIESVRRLPTGDYDFTAFGIEPCNVSDVVSRRQLIHALVLAIKYLGPEDRLRLCDTLVRRAGRPLPQDMMMTSSQVTDLARRGFDIGGHTVHHPILTCIDAASARQEIETNRDALAQLIGRRPVTFAYPNGKPERDYTAIHAQLVREAGYKVAVSTATAVATAAGDRFQLPRFVLNERMAPTVVARVCRMAKFRRPQVAQA